MKIMFIDLETSGLNPERHNILQFAYIIYDTESKETLDSGKTYINHDSLTISKGAYMVNKISLDTIFSSEVSELDLVNKIEHLVKTYNVEAYGGYNIFAFDLEFLKKLFTKQGRLLSGLSVRKIIDVYLMVKGKYNTKNNKLGTICETLNIPIDQHKAEEDILATLEIYKKVI